MALPPCPLPERTLWVSNNSARTKTVTMAAVHESVGGTEAVGLAQFTQRAGVSYHAIADNDKLVYTVARSRMAWHIRNGNPRIDGLCLCTPVAGYSRAQWLGPQNNKVNVAAWWLAIVCADRGIDLEQCTAQNIRDALAGNRAAGGATTHNDYTLATRDGTHTDPRNFPMDVCIARAVAMARGGGPAPAPHPDPAPAPPSAGYPSLHEGDVSELVWRLQVFLNRVFSSYSHIDAGDRPPSRLGPQTRGVLEEFQRRVGIPTTPPFECGPKTWAELVRHGFR